MRRYILPGALLLAIIAAGAAWFLREKPAQRVVDPVVQPAAPPVASPAPAVPAHPPADCLLPGPPPVPPNGATATAADMQLGQKVAQHFVNQLELYQACRNDQIDHTTDASAERKQVWVEQGNAAVDQANAIAGAFSDQLKIFKARQARPHS